jgi:hypothetical protein
MLDPVSFRRGVLAVRFACAAALTMAVLPGEAHYPPVPTPEQRELLRKEAPGTRARAPEPEVDTAQDDFDVTRYFLDLAFDTHNQVVSGSVTITATSLAPGFQTLVLDLYPSMVVSSVMRGTTALTFVQTNPDLIITLDQPFDPSESFEVVVTYSGTPVSGGFGYFGWNKYSGQSTTRMAWSLSEPDGAQRWWPCKDRPDDKAMVEEWYTVPAKWIATGNGVLTDVITLSGNRKQYRWVASRPLTTYLVSIAATDYVTFSDTYIALDGTPMSVDYYVYSEDLAEAQESFNRTTDMIAFYAGLFGEYPFLEDKYGMSAFPVSGGMEHSTNTSYGYGLINGGHGYDFIIAHELAHQWWGDSVSPETWPDVWLNEGFATYSEALWYEHENGPQGYRDYMNSLWHQTFSGTLYNPSNLFGTTVYDKGAWVQHMLRGVMGDAAFFDGQRDWYEQHRDTTGNTAQYRATLEARHGAPLAWFFNEWVYGSGSPRYEYGFTTANLGNGSYRNYVRIHQVQGSPGPFTMPVRLTLVTPSGSEVRTVWNDAVDQDFVLDTSEPPNNVLFDADNWILKASLATVLLVDTDGDGVPDRNDNCAATLNPAQANLDGDASGDACDDDDDGDLLVDVADCAPLDSGQGIPDEVASLSAQRGADSATELSWSAAERADGYDVARGLLAQLASGSYGLCWQEMIPGTAFTDAEQALGEGEGFFYLVRGRDTGCGGGGPFGFDSGGAPIPSPCP